MAKSQPMVLPLARGLVSRYVKEIGGRVALWDLESFTAHATLAFTGGQATGQLDLAFRRPNLMRIHLDLADLGSSVVGSDGLSAWEIVTTDKVEEAEIIPMADAQRRRRELNWFELAIRLTEGARSFRTVAPAEFENYPCWEIQKITRDGVEERLFIDREHFLLRGIRMIEEGPLEDHEVTMSFRDWKPIKPLLLFHELAVTRDDIELIIRFDKISLDTVSPTTFQPPPSVEDLLRAIPQDEPPVEDDPGESQP